jgi:deoxyribose-phosphate aldolase
MEAIKHGAQELEVMINLGFFRAGDEDYTLNEIRNIMNVSHSCIHKIIIETGLLTQTEKKKACQLIMKTGAAFVKTSTGFGPSGATTEDIQLLTREAGKKAKVKASGGIRNLQRVEELWKAGASRIGTSAAVSIMREFENQSGLQNRHSKAS